MGRARENLGNGLTVSYASYNKPSITRGTTTIGFNHDPEHQRFKEKHLGIGRHTRLRSLHASTRGS